MTSTNSLTVDLYESTYQSEVHDGFSHELSKKTKLHFDLGDVSWFGSSSERYSKQTPGAEHILGSLMSPYRERDIKDSTRR